MILIAIIFALYIAALTFLWVFWNKSKTKSISLLTENTTAENLTSPFISVLIPVRNEAINLVFLLQDFENQTLSHRSFEVIIIDDDSTDGTDALVKSFQAKFNLHYLKAPQQEGVAFKKKAIAAGIVQSSGQLIVCTDGDCRVLPTWLASIFQAQQTSQAVFISAPVTFSPSKSLFGQLQTIEFASLIATGGACMQAGFPNMCNGANIAYLKSAYEQVNGFEGLTTLASGDDEFLMHKMAVMFPNKILFLNNQQAVVQTKAQATWHNFYHQRRRWSSKWRNYQDHKITILAVAIVGLHLTFMGTWLTCFFSTEYIFIPISLLAVKALSEFLFLQKVVNDCGGQWKNRAFLLLQICYSPYVVWFGLNAALLPKGYQWKGRNVQ